MALLIGAAEIDAPTCPFDQFTTPVQPVAVKVKDSPKQILDFMEEIRYTHIYLL